jgi:hypothetical protein
MTEENMKKRNTRQEIKREGEKVLLCGVEDPVIE